MAPRTYYFTAQDGDIMRQWLDALQRLTSSQRASRMGAFKIIRSVEIRVVEAKDLPRSGDHYCLVLIDDDQQVRVLFLP